MGCDLNRAARAIDCFAFALLAVLSPSGLAAASGPVVQTSDGPVRGIAGEVNVFRGIPYAAPPIGLSRWRPPAPPARWSETRDATQPGPICPQPVRFRPTQPGVVPATPPIQSEDCLTLHVWSPAADRRLPVIVWLHGGGFTVGSGTGNLGILARHGAVVVGVNYRLGPLGFLAHPELSRESQDGVSGNYGLHDQIAALRWVRSNIAAFGGDPENVTLMGQSAGATSAAVLLLSEQARGLYHRVILQSIGGSFLGPKQRLREPYYGMASAEADGLARVPDLAKYRDLSATELLSRLPSAPTIKPGAHYYPVIDGRLLLDEPETLLRAGRAARVPLLIGHNADEGLFWSSDAPNSIAAYHDYVRAWLPEGARENALARYPASNDSEARAASLRLTGDYRVVAPTLLLARALAETQPVFLYRFSRVAPFHRSTWGGAAHGTELPYVFGEVADRTRYDDRDGAISSSMMAAWVRFAATGNPNGRGFPSWPRYRALEQRAMEFGDKVALCKVIDDNYVAFFAAAYEALRTQPPAM